MRPTSPPTVRVRFNRDLAEYCVQLIRPGNPIDDRETYYTDDRDDAYGTADAMRRDMQATNPTDTDHGTDHGRLTQP